MVEIVNAGTLRELTLRVRTLIKDHNILAGGILQVSITKQMMISIRSARSIFGRQKG